MLVTRSPIRLAAALAIVLLVSAACANDDPGPASGDPGTTGTTAADVSGPTASTGMGDDGTAGYGDAGSGYGKGGGDDGGGGSGAKIDVQANNFSFDPAELEFEAGEDIHVKNGNANTPHTFTVDGTDIDVRLDPLEEAEVTLDLDPGAYDFHCEFHPQMTGTLTIA
jgi:plastocyanin